ncbi:Stk1 family PASTA domain-containing Ser/Thr kinase [Aestuariimicrobium soli]|uniref:Stk1 family PASTA domain-containing Ser/Thr kinase n=1 Tax=Aestuariimicrobium soli TaxID=2035834 RepID=UPI003EBB27E4
MTSSGTLLGGRYLLDSVIGRGGMAEVWKARDSRLGRDVAVKRLRADLSSDPTFQARFRREAQAAAGLNHHNIVAVYDTGEEMDDSTGVHVPYIVMELVQGHTLRDVLRDGRKILPERALEFVSGVLDALAYSHKSGIVHRDIKPANVMLTPQGQVKVMDFGIARAVADTSATMTQTAAVIGTAQYLSPEQARGETVDQRSDIYSAGCLLYELLVGRPPFTGDSPVSVAYQHVRELPVPPSQLDHEITPAMDAITLKALSKSPADRYQDARAMREDIGRLLAGEPVTAPSPTTPASPDTASAPTQLMGTAVAGAGLAAAGAGVAGVGAAGAGAGGAAALGGPRYGASSTGTQQAVTDTGTFMPAGRDTGTMTAVDDQPRRRRGLVLVIALVLLLAGVIGYGAWQVFSDDTPPPPAQARVPSVIGSNRASAESQIINAGLKVGKVTEVNGPDETKNQVTKQNPEPLKMVNEGTAVDITINLGVKTGQIPSGLVGKSEAVAKQALQAAGFTSRTETAPVSPESLAQKPGMVVTTDPAEGAEVPEGKEVVIYLSPTEAPVPNLSGMDETEARTAAQSAGFPDITVRTKATPNDNEVGKVIDQNPTDGNTLSRDKFVTVTLGVKKDTVAIPQVVGVSVAVAQDRLTTAGFTNVKIKETETDSAAPGTVIGVDPAEAKEIKPTDKVTLEVAKAKPTPPPSTPSGDASSADPSASSSGTGG